MKKIGFVTPWYGKDIPGGAEMELRGIVKHLQLKGIKLDVLTTCVKEFSSDWSLNYHKQGMEYIDDICVRRFPVIKRNDNEFAKVNYKLMNNIKISSQEEQTFVNEMINSPELYSYIKQNKEEYHLFIFIPYMFGTTYFGCKACLEKAVLIPCFHDESYLYLNIFKEVFSNIKGMIYNAYPEYLLANKIFSLSNMKQIVMGIGMDTNFVANPKRFREKYDINQEFILYAGRKDKGKNVDTLLIYFRKYKERVKNQLKLVLIGGGSIEFPEELKSEILDLGFIDVKDKYDACAAALALCQPSKNESFSLVMMESWLCGRPTLVHKDCEVTRYFVEQAQGGLYFENYFEFEGCINYWLQNPLISNQMGESGKGFVKDNFSWDVITDKYIRFFEEI